METRPIRVAVLAAAPALAIAIAIAAAPAGAGAPNAGSPEPGGPPRAVLVVRHAEKETGSPDPALDAAGRERAAALARALADVPLDAVYSTPFRRTLETAQAVLDARDGRAERIETPYGGDVEAFARALAERLLRERPGGTALVVGHSNTVPATLRALGVRDVPELDERDYDDLFVVLFGADGAARLLHLHYGAPSP